MPFARYIRFNVRDDLGSTGTTNIRIKGAYDFTAVPMPTVAEVEALRDSIFGDDKLANVHVDSWEVVVFSNSDPVSAVGDANPLNNYWKCSVNQGVNDFSFRIPGARSASGLRSSETIANLGSSEWAALKTLLEGAEYEIANPDPDIAHVTTATLHGAQYMRAAKVAPREKVNVP